MYFLNILLAFSILFLCPSDLFAKMYKWVDENGKISFSDKPPPEDDKVKDVKEYKTYKSQRWTVRCDIEHLKTLVDFTKSDLKYMKADRWKRHYKEVLKGKKCLENIQQSCGPINSKSPQYVACMEGQHGMKLKAAIKLYIDLKKQLELIDLTADE